ncbi:MAG: glucose-1-phosphate thymidylyltransferase [Leptospiraceae bacterium]|nr:glucose-1-phosphate thymidylyltransferase [Leptospiraceae bacterium]MCP5510570.1 glucose-1-phosphate thymidylyltransferase [Leptospiraceae bacterium]
MFLNRVLIDESNLDSSQLIPYRLFSFSELKDGIYSPLERLRILNPDVKIFYKHSNPIFSEAFLQRYPFIQPYSNEDVEFSLTPETYKPWEIIQNIGNRIREDIDILKSHKKWPSKFKVKPNLYSTIGKPKNLIIHSEVDILPNVVFDVRKGPVIIDKGVKISPFTYIEGPVYIGPGTHLDNARITGGCIIGTTCRLGGEIENSYIGDFTNKHHEGFLGHSFVGSWVNIGALATTSDLKNNYGIVKIHIKDKSITTNTIKFGSIIGDFSKIAIGTMMNTGSTIDIGCNIIAERHSGYSESFRWASKDSKYRLDIFINDTKKIMARRNQTLTIEMENLLKNLYED